MKALLQKIKETLQENLDYVRDKDIYITPHINLVPPASKYPCIGLKDGRVTRKELAGDMLEITMQVHIVPYVRLIKEDETGIQGTAVKKGILDMVQDIHDVLDDNLILPEIQAAFCPAERESELFNDGKIVLTRKVLIYEYVKEVARV